MGMHTELLKAMRKTREAIELAERAAAVARAHERMTMEASIRLRKWQIGMLVFILVLLALVLARG